MPIEVRCECNKRYRVPERYASKRFRCKACGDAISVPGSPKSPKKSPKAQKARGRPAKKFKKPEKGTTSRPLDPVAKRRKAAELAAASEAVPKKAKKKRRRKAASSDQPEARRGKPEEARKDKPRKQARKAAVEAEAPAQRTRRRPTRDDREAAGRKPKRSASKRAGKRAEAASRKARGVARRLPTDEGDAAEQVPAAGRGLPLPLVMIGAALVVLLLGVALVFAFRDTGPDQAQLAAFGEKLEKIDAVLANGFIAPAVTLLDKQSQLATELDLSADPGLARSWRQLEKAREPLADLARAAKDLEGLGLQEVLEASNHELPRVRLAAVMLLRDVEEEGVDEALYALVEEDDERVRAALRQAFVERGGEDVIVPLLVEALDQDANLQAAERLLAYSDALALSALARNLPEMTYHRGMLRRTLAHLEEHGTSAQAAELLPFLELVHKAGMQLSQQQLKDFQSEVETLSRSLE